MYNEQLDKTILEFIKKNNLNIGDIIQYTIQYSIQYSEQQQHEIFDFIIQKNLTESAKFLIQKDKENINVQYGNGWTLLINALFNNREEIAIELINAGADINIKLENGRTALIIAFQNKLKDVLEILIDRVNKEDLEFLLTIQDQSNKECIQIVNNKIAIIEETKQITSKEQATEKEIEVIVQYINTQKLKHDDKVYKTNIKSPHTYTLLEWACWKGHLEIVKLLATEENINVRGTNYNAPLHFACMKKGNIEVVKYLVENGADVNDHLEGNTTALIYASDFAKDEEIVKYLLNTEGIDINAKSGSGKTALMDAILFRQENIAKILIEAGADINIQYEDKETVLIKAYKYGLVDTVNLLVEYGAIFNKNILKTKFTGTIPQEKQEKCKKIIETEIQKIENFGEIKINNRIITKKTFNNNNIIICDIIQAIRNKQLKFNYKVYDFSNKQYTLLEWSIIKGHLKIFRLLINKYNFDFVNIYTCTPLIYAYLYKQPEMIKILVQYGFGVNSNPQYLLIKAFSQLEEDIKQAEINIEKIINGEESINLDEYDKKIEIDKEIILAVGYGLHKLYEKSQGKSLIDLNTIQNSKKESMLEIVCKINDSEFLENILELYFKENEKQYFINYIDKVLNIILNGNSYNSKIIETIVGQMQYYNILENYCDRILDFAIKYNFIELIKCIVGLSKYFDETKITKEILNKFNEEDKEYIQEKIEFQKQIKKLIIWEELKPEQLVKIKTLIEKKKIFWNDKLYKLKKYSGFYTLFEWAFIWGYIDIVNLLINKYNIKFINKSIFNTCLYSDYKLKEKLKIIELLFKKGLNIDNTDDINFDYKEYKVFIEDQIALKNDIVKANVDRVQELLKIDRKLSEEEIEEFKQLIVNTHVQFSYIFTDVKNIEISLFEWLCKNKYNDILKLLINKIDINLLDCNNNIIFFISIIGNNPEIVQYMIYKGVDINYKSNQGWRAIDIAIDHNNTDIAKILLNKKGIILQDLNEKQLTRYQEAFLKACSEGWTEMVELIIKAGGVNLNYNNFFQDAIVEASKGDNFKIVEMLILSGVSVDEKLLEKCTGEKCKEVVQTELNRKKEVEKYKEVVRTKLNHKKEVETLEEILIRRFDDKKSFKKIIEFLKEKKFRLTDTIDGKTLTNYINDSELINNLSNLSEMNNLFINKYNINTILDNNNNTVLCLLKNYYQFHMQHKIYMIEFNYMLKSKPNFQNLENIIKFEIKKNDKTPELEDLIKQYNNTNSIELLQEISDFIELHGFEFNTELDIGKEYKCTLLEWACEKGCLDIVKKLAYEDKYNVNYIFDYHGETPWMVAYKNHHLGVADYLVQQDAIIDKEFKDKVDKEENPEKYKQEKIRVLKSEMEEMKKMMEKMQKMSIFKTDFNEMEEIASKIGFSYLDKFNENLKLFSQQISSLNNELSMLEGEKQKK